MSAYVFPFVQRRGTGCDWGNRGGISNSTGGDDDHCVKLYRDKDVSPDLYMSRMRFDVEVPKGDIAIATVWSGRTSSRVGASLDRAERVCAG